MSESPAILELAGMVAFRPLTATSYKRDDLIAGIAAERARLQSYKYVGVLSQQVYDYDGLTEYVYLLGGFNSEKEAAATVREGALQLLKQQTTPVEGSREVWALETPTNPRLRPSPKELNLAQVVFDWEYKLRGGAYDTKYNWFRVIGPFKENVVCADLIRTINSDHELWSYFVNVGEALRNGLPARGPHKQ